MRPTLLRRFLSRAPLAKNLHPNDPRSFGPGIDLDAKRPEGPPPFDFVNNPYPARTQWPPEFSTLHPRAKFLYEKKFRRRSKLKWARPQWNKWLLTIQNFAVIGTIVYALLYMDWTMGGKSEEPRFITRTRELWKDLAVGESWKDKKERLEASKGGDGNAK